MTGPAPVCWAVIPVKAPGAGKTRLAGVLDGCQRQALVAAMLERVVAAAQGCEAVERVCLVGPSDHGLGDRVTWWHESGASLNGAVGAALRSLAHHGEPHARHPELVSGSIAPQAPRSEPVSRDARGRTDLAEQAASWTLKQVQGDDAQHRQFASQIDRIIPDRIIITPADLPQVDALDFAMLADVPDDAIALAPDRHGTGTNALSLPASALPAFTFHFGPGSFATHLTEVARLGYKMQVQLSAGLEKDIDELADLPDASECLHEV